MAQHTYENPGARETVTRTSIDGTVAIPPVTAVEVWDGNDRLTLSFTDLDALDEMCRLFEKARAEHVAALLDGRSEKVTVDRLEPDDLAVLDGELVMVESIVIDGQHVHVRYGRQYQGAYDLTAGRSIRCVRSERVVRLLPSQTLSAVR